MQNQIINANLYSVRITKKSVKAYIQVKVSRYFKAVEDFKNSGFKIEKTTLIFDHAESIKQPELIDLTCVQGG